jgi:hypothetical protein
MVVNGWTLLFHDAIIGQLNSLTDAYRRARKADPKGFRSNANVKLLASQPTRAGPNIVRAIPSARPTGIGFVPGSLAGFGCFFATTAIRG